jgi:glutamyl-tRNA reductase
MEANTYEQSSTDVSDREELDPEAVRGTIRAHGEEIKGRELQKAFNRLDANGELTSEQREIVRQMATAIVDGVLAAPELALKDTRQVDRETMQTAIGLFDPDQ